MNNIAISAQNLSKEYRLYNSPLDRLKESVNPFGRRYHHEFFALKNVSFDVKRGETFGVLGKNGSGKSTLLKILSGVLTPTAGTVVVNGRVSALLELGAGFNPELTGLENVYFNGTLMGYSRQQMQAKVDDILAYADIGEFAFQPVKSYSSGMFVRLAFAVAINVDPDILIVDEALAVGDMFFQAKCIATLDRFRERGTSILFVSHDINTIKSLCTKAMYLEEGVVVTIGPAREVADIYVKNARKENERESFEGIVKSLTPESADADTGVTSNGLFDPNNDFSSRVADFRYGTGEVKFINAELVDLHGHCVEWLDFDAPVTIRLHVCCCSESIFSVNYAIRNDLGIPIIGSNFRIEGHDLISGHHGDRYIVEFETRLPLAAGDYNVQISISEPLVVNHTAKFVDFIENAIVFKVAERPSAKIWAKLYIDNKLKIQKVA